MVREKGDVAAATSLLNQVTYLDLACAKMTNMTQPNGGDAAILACRTARETLRTNILLQMKCNKYSSQVCSYLQRTLTGVLGISSGSGGTRLVGKDLTAKVTGYDLTYREVISKVVTDAPNVLHNSFWAKEDPNFVIARTMLYNLISSATLANILVHILDAMFEWSVTGRLMMRFIVFTASFVPSLLFLIGEGGASTILFVGIFMPAMVNLIYFEFFLDDTMDRPWVHPFFFSVVYASLTLLSLTENGVLNSSIVIVELLKAQAASQLFMEVVWYWTGYKEKERFESPAATSSGSLFTYLTRQIQYALFMSIVLVVLFPLSMYIAPYDFDNADMFCRIAPLLFTGLSVVGTIFLQGLILDENYGIDTKEEWATRPGDTRARIVANATRITGGKLGVSALVIVFIACIEFNFLAEYLRTLRAYYDTMPTTFPLIDLTSTFAMGLNTVGLMQMIET